jgi:ribose transport system permease protein
VKEVLERFGTVIALVVMIVYFAIATSGDMVTSQNIAAILNQIAVLGVLAIGLTVCLVLGQFDLSIGWTASLAGMVATGLMSQHGTPMLVAVAAAVGVGALVGLVNGLIVTVLRVNALLATLAVGSVISGLINWYSISPFTSGIAPSFKSIGQDKVIGIPNAAIVLAVIGIGLWVFLQQTAGGRRMYAIGGNEEAARVAGVNIRRVQLLAFVICGVCAAVSGLLLAAQLGSGQPTGAVGLMLSAFAGAFLGSATWREGEFHVGGTIVGVLILGVVFSGLALTDAAYYLKDIITGAILVIAVGAASVMRARTT